MVGNRGRWFAVWLAMTAVIGLTNLGLAQQPAGNEDAPVVKAKGAAAGQASKTKPADDPQKPIPEESSQDDPPPGYGDAPQADEPRSNKSAETIPQEDAPPGYGEAGQAGEADKEFEAGGGYAEAAEAAEPGDDADQQMVLGVPQLANNGASPLRADALTLESIAKILDDDLPPAAAQVKQFEGQYMQQILPVMRQELSLFKRLVEPSPEQLKPVGILAKKAATWYCRQFANMQMGGFRQDTRVASLSRVLELTLVTAAKRHVSGDASAQYADYIAQRTQRRQRLGAALVVSRLDRRLYLTVEQRTELTEILAEKWDGAWNAASFMSNNPEYFPSDISNLIRPVLVEEQKSVWGTLQKVQFSSWGPAAGGGFLGGGLQDVVVEEESP